MTGEAHVLTTIGGVYKNAPLLAEIWEVTLRHALVAGSVDDVGTFPTNLTVQTADIARTETDWTIDGIWNVHVGSLAGAVFNVDDWLNDQVAPAVSDWASSSYMSNQCQASYIKAYLVGSPSGKAIPGPGQTQGSPITLTWTSSFPVGSGTGTLPVQDALVMSHRTNQTGRRGRGRMYLPGIPPSKINTQGVIDSTSAAGFASRQAGLLEAVIYAGSGLDPYNIRPCVTGKPYVNYGVIDTVLVGQVVDTQQRRRVNIDEAYVSQAVSY